MSDLVFDANITIEAAEFDNQSLERNTDLHIAKREWWQSQFDSLRPTLMPQAKLHYQLSRDTHHCRMTIFSKPIATPFQSGGVVAGNELVAFDEFQYIQGLLSASCNIWTLLHVCALYHRSFTWKNARTALYKITCELSGRNRPHSDLSREVFYDLIHKGTKNQRRLFQRSLQHLYWLTGEAYVYHERVRWKREYNDYLTALHWCYLILNMNDKQVGIIHNKFLLDFIQNSPKVRIEDLCFLLAARMEAGLFNKGVKTTDPESTHEAFVSDTSQAIFDRLFAICTLHETDIVSVSDFADSIGSYLVENVKMDIVDRLIHSLAKYPDLIALNHRKYSYKIWLRTARENIDTFLFADFVKHLLFAIERKLLLQRKTDGIMNMMTRITNNILLIHNHYNVIHSELSDKNSTTNQQELSQNMGMIQEWSRLFYDNFERLTVSEALVLLQTLMDIDGETETKTDVDGVINWPLITKLSFHQFNLQNLQNLCNEEMRQLLELLMQLDRRYQHALNENEHERQMSDNEKRVIPASLIVNIESIICDKMSRGIEEEIDTELVMILETCLDYFECNKTKLIKAQQEYMRRHGNVQPHWHKFYESNSEQNAMTSEWWRK